MKEIKELFNKIAEEIEGAECYAKQALRYHDIDRERANTYLDMSKQELNHVDRLHEMVKKVIRQYKESGQEIPKGMEEIYDWQHDSMISWVAKVRNLYEMFK